MSAHFLLKIHFFSRVHATLYVTMSVRRSVRNHFVQNHFFGHLELNGDQIWVTAPAQLLYCPCPPARDWCCRVYGLVLFIRTQFTSKGSYRSWKKIVKVWMMMMMKEGIFALSCSSPPSTSPRLLLPYLPLPSNRSPSSPSTHPCSAHPCELKWQNAS